jgi:hypothetical protein
MVYFLGILISLAAGYLSIRLLTAGRLNPILHILLALALGFGIDGTAAFYSHILFNQFNRFLPIGLVALSILILCFIKDSLPLGFRKTKNKKTAATEKNMTFLKKEYGWGILALVILGIPLAISAHYFPLGGWDAWSCWNLKAKFIFLGHDNWKDVLAPGLWRSNTQYPLLWPLVNVWFFDLCGKFDQAVPMLNSIVFALLTAGILLFGLWELTGMLIPAILAAVIVTAIPFGVTLYISQYSDALLGLFLLSAFLSFLLAEKYDLPKLKILSLVFLGLMSFTKNEGLIAAGIAALGLFWHERSHKKGLKTLILAFFIALLPTIIFMIFFAPKNEAFINGLTSTDKPTNWSRLIVILVYPWFEFISGKWNGFWLLALGGILLAGKKLWQSTLGVIGLSLALYLGVVMAYYAVNTFFEINWWLSTTLSRILFALVPTIALWIGVAVIPPTKGGQGRVG